MVAEKDDGISVAPHNAIYDTSAAEKGVLEVPRENELHRALKARHITMIGEPASAVAWRNPTN
jgi:amino acid transporter